MTSINITNNNEVNLAEKFNILENLENVLISENKKLCDIIYNIIVDNALGHVFVKDILYEDKTREEMLSYIPEFDMFFSEIPRNVIIDMLTKDINKMEMAKKIIKSFENNKYVNQSETVRDIENSINQLKEYIEIMM